MGTQFKLCNTALLAVALFGTFAYIVESAAGTGDDKAILFVHLVIWASAISVLVTAVTLVVGLVKGTAFGTRILVMGVLLPMLLCLVSVGTCAIANN